MNCVLCKKLIHKPNPLFNRLKINESQSVDICSDCIDKFLKWQQGIFANLFPTKAIKKRYGKG